MGGGEGEKEEIGEGRRKGEVERGEGNNRCDKGEGGGCENRRVE